MFTINKKRGKLFENMSDMLFPLLNMEILSISFFILMEYVYSSCFLFYSPMMTSCSTKMRRIFTIIISAAKS